MEGFAELPEVLAKLAVAVVLGGVIGWERETHDRPAGLRTHVLVCVGSAVYMILSMSFSQNADPGRIASQVAAGMGFLGAGTIIRHGNAVRGLTTAASLWAVAAIGLCVGRGEAGYMIAIATTVFVFITLRGLSWVERRVLTKRRYKAATLQVRRVRELMPRLQSLLDGQGVRVQSCEIGDPDAEGLSEVRLNLRLPPGVGTDRLTITMTSLEDLLSVDWD